jgi:hypothetical protein
LFDYEDWLMNANEYYNLIQIRKDNFRMKTKNRSWLSWNYADWEANRKLKSGMP